MSNSNSITDRLDVILHRLQDIHGQQQREGIIMRLELEERTALGLTGMQAIEHYNQWMRQYGLTNLIVQQ